MVILIGTQKGGAGKSTFTLLLSNYLAQLQKHKLTVLDLDYQQSIFNKYKQDKVKGNPEGYSVMSVDLKSFPTILSLLKARTDELILIDLPGKMDDDLLIPVLASGDVIFSPFNYDEFSVDSTLLFALVCRQINPKAKMVFVPNRIKANVRHETKRDVDDALKKFGSITCAISDRVDYQRLNTVSISKGLLPYIRPILDQIYIHHLFKTEV